MLRDKRRAQLSCWQVLRDQDMHLKCGGEYRHHSSDRRHLFKSIIALVRLGGSKKAHSSQAAQTFVLSSKRLRDTFAWVVIGRHEPVKACLLSIDTHTHTRSRRVAKLLCRAMGQALKSLLLSWK